MNKCHLGVLLPITQVFAFISTLYAGDPRHIGEVQYMTLARALRKAVELDPRVVGIPSTKGSL